MCGECKGIACDKMEKFMTDFEAGIEKARKGIDKLNFVKFS
jgi:tryptophanyl-tRNA synthetase